MARTSLQTPHLDGRSATQVALPTYMQATAEDVPTYANATDFRTLITHRPQEASHFQRANHGRHARNLRDFLYYIMSKDYGISYPDPTHFFHVAWCFRQHSATVHLNIPPTSEETRCIQELIYGPSAAVGIPIAAVRRTLESYVNSSHDESGEYEGCLNDLETKKLAEKICIDLNLVLPAICADRADFYVFSKALDRALEMYFSSLPAELESTSTWATSLRAVLKKHRERMAAEQRRQKVLGMEGISC